MPSRPPSHALTPGHAVAARPWEIARLDTMPVLPAARPRTWPDASRRDHERLKWQVWIGFQIRLWRYQNGHCTVSQKEVQLRSGLPQTVLSKIEHGLRRIDLAELVAIARAHQKTPTDLGALFLPPTPTGWRHVCAERVDDPAFAVPPTGNPFGGGEPPA